MGFFTGLNRFASVYYSDLKFANAQRNAEHDSNAFITDLKKNEAMRRHFWDFILDFQNFKKWPTQSKNALFEEAGYEGLATFYQHPKAIALVTAATLALLVLPSVPFALAMGAGTLLFGTTLSIVLLTSLVVTSLVADFAYVPEDKSASKNLGV